MYLSQAFLHTDSVILLPRDRAPFGQHQESQPLVLASDQVQHRKSAICGLPSLTRFFYNLAKFVFQYFCDSRRILASFAKFFHKSLKLPSISQTCFFWHDKILQTPTHVLSFSCANEVAQNPHENDVSGANTRGALARFCDNNREKGKDFVKICHVKKQY